MIRARGAGLRVGVVVPDHGAFARALHTHRVKQANRRAAVDDLRFRECLYSLLQSSHLSENVVLLQFVRRDAQLRRAVTVLKTRASGHDPNVREFRITPGGIVLDEPPDKATR